jgi:hypothetical protein
LSRRFYEVSQNFVGFGSLVVKKFVIVTVENCGVGDKNKNGFVCCGYIVGLITE